VARHARDPSVDERRLWQRERAVLADAAVVSGPAGNVVGDKHDAAAVRADLAQDADQALEQRVGGVPSPAPLQWTEVAACEHELLLARLSSQPRFVVDLLFNR